MFYERITELVLLLYAGVYFALIRKKLPEVPEQKFLDEKGTRNHFFDFVKGLAIFGVLMVHIHLVFNDGTLNQDFDRIFRFAIPVFFIVSGALTHISDLSQRSLKQYAKSKFFRIVIPYLLFSLAATTLTKTFLTPLQYFSIAFKDIVFGSALLPYYFIPALIQMYFLYPILSFFLYRQKVSPVFLLFISLIINILSFVFIPFTDKTHIVFTHYLFFFCFGMVFRSYFLEGARNWLHQIHFLPWTIFAVFMTFLLAQVNPNEALYNIRIVYGITLFLLFFLVYPRMLRFPKICYFLEVFGRYSLFVYLVHFFIILLMPRLFSSQSFLLLSVMYGLIVIFSLFTGIFLQNLYEYLLQALSLSRRSAVYNHGKR